MYTNTIDSLSFSLRLPSRKVICVAFDCFLCAVIYYLLGTQWTHAYVPIGPLAGPNLYRPSHTHTHPHCIYYCIMFFVFLYPLFIYLPAPSWSELYISPLANRSIFWSPNQLLAHTWSGSVQTNSCSTCQWCVSRHWLTKLRPSLMITSITDHEAGGSSLAAAAASPHWPLDPVPMDHIRFPR